MVLTIVHHLAIITATVSVWLSVYHSWGMLSNIREDKRISAHLFSAFIPFMPGLLTEKGNYHRVRLGWFLVGVLISAAIVIAIQEKLIPGQQ